MSHRCVGGRLSTPAAVPEPSGCRPPGNLAARACSLGPQSSGFPSGESGKRGQRSPPGESILQFTGSRNPYLTAQESNETHLKIWSCQALRLYRFSPADLPLLFQSVSSARFLLIQLLCFFQPTSVPGSLCVSCSVVSDSL